MAEVARMFQVSPKRLETWKGEWRAKGELAFPGNGSRPQSKLDADQIAQLERKIGQQAMEIEFLKKALRRFREHPLPVVGNGEIRRMESLHISAKADDKCRAATLRGHWDQRKRKGGHPLSLTLRARGA
jgi:hypothetical protein